MLREVPDESVDIAKRFKNSLVSYGGRQVTVTLLTIAYNLALTRFLLPEQFGEVAVVMIAINVATLIADGGLGVYLIQRSAHVTDVDLWRVASFQLYVALAFLTLSVVTAVGWDLVGSAHLAWLIAAASLSLPLLVVRGTSLLMLERQIRMGKVVRVEVLEETVFAVVATVLAYRSFGAWSIVIAQAAKAFIGCAVAMRVSGFRVRIVPVNWDADLRNGVRFGLHYQGAQLINMARIAVNPLFVVPVLGLQAGGFVERGWYLAGAVLSIILAVQKRVIFPYVSRIQHDIQRIRGMLEDSVYVSGALDKLLFLPMILFAEELVLLLFGDHWLPMLPLLYWLLAGNILFGALSGPLYPVASGIGFSSLLSRYNLIVFILSWILIIPLTLMFGITGVGIAGLLLWATIHWLRSKLSEKIGAFMYYRQAAKPLLAFTFAWIAVEGVMDITGIEARNLPEIVLWSFIAVAIYVGALLATDFDRVQTLWRRFSLRTT